MSRNIQNLSTRSGVAPAPSPSLYVEGWEERLSSIYLFHLEVKPRLDAVDHEVAKAINELDAKETLAMCELRDLKHLRLCSPVLQTEITEPFATVKIFTHDSDGRPIKSAMPDVQKILRNKVFVIRPNLSSSNKAEHCLRAAQFGYTNVPLHVAYYKKADDGVLFFLTLTPRNFRKEISRSCADDIAFATKWKRDKRGLGQPQFGIQAETVRQESFPFPVQIEGEIQYLDATLVTARVTGLWHQGKPIELFGLGYEFKYVNIHAKQPNHQFFQTYLTRSLDGSVFAGAIATNRLLSFYAIPGSVFGHVNVADGAKFTKEDASGHDKGNALFAALRHDLLFVVCGTKTEVFRTDQRVWTFFDALKPFDRVNSDYESYLNANFASCKFPGRDMSLLQACMQDLVTRHHSMMFDLENCTHEIAKRMPVIDRISDDVEEDEDEKAIENLNKWVLPQLVQSLDANRFLDPDGKPYGIIDSARVMDKYLRYARTQFLDSNDQVRGRFEFPINMAATGYIFADPAIVRHSDPALEGACFNFDAANLEPYEASMNWLVEKVVDGRTDGLTDGRTVIARIPLEATAFLHRRPWATIIEGIDRLNFVKKPGYDFPTSPFMLMSVKPIEIDGEADEFLRKVVPADILNELYADFRREDGRIFIPFIVVSYAIMGGGDGDDLGVAYLNQIATHCSNHYQRLMPVYPNPDLTCQAAPAPVQKKAAPVVAGRGDIRAAFNNYLSSKSDQEISALTKMLTDGTIGSLGILEFVINGVINHYAKIDKKTGIYNLDLLQSKVPKLLEACGICRQKEKIIDQAKMGKGNLDLKRIEAIRKAVYEELAASGLALPKFIHDRIPADYKTVIRSIKTQTDKDWAAVQADIVSHFNNLKDIYCFPKVARSFSFLLDYPVASDVLSQAKDLRKEFTAEVGRRQAEIESHYQKVFKHLRGKSKEAAIKSATTAANIKAIREIDEDLYVRIPFDRMIEIAIATYQLTRKAAKSEIRTDSRGKQQRYEFYSEGQVWLSVMGNFLIMGMEKAYAFLNTPTPTPTPDMTPDSDPESLPGMSETLPEIRQKIVTLVNGAKGKSPAVVNALLQPAEEGKSVKLCLLSADNPEDMEILHSYIPKFKADGTVKDAVVVFLGKEVYAWVVSENIPEITRLSKLTGAKQFTGKLYPSFGRRQFSVDCMVQF